MIVNEYLLCGCDPRVGKQVLDLTNSLHVPIIVTRGKDPPENAPKDSAPKSKHFLGLAADCTASNVHPYKIAVELLKNPNIKGLAVNIFSRFVHFDFRESDELIEWTYDRTGREI